MRKLIKRFAGSEEGAVTVDWVVLTAAVVALGGAAYSNIESGATTLTGNTASALEAAQVDPAL